MTMEWHADSSPALAPVRVWLFDQDDTFMWLVDIWEPLEL